MSEKVMALRVAESFHPVVLYSAQKREFRHYVGGLLGESERKNLFQLAENAIGVTYHRLHHFLTQAPCLVYFPGKRTALGDH
ncbi:transposase [Nostoc sp. WHI]|nr:transposase [Nostoc sp. WHI]MBG1272043.1 transposase [Nostoc sp. WHI]